MLIYYIGLGKHLIADIGIFPEVDIELCLEKMLDAVTFMGAKILKSDYSRNPDQAYVLLDASHIALHVIENGKERKAALDIFTCGDCDPVKGYDYLKKEIRFFKDNYTLYERFLDKKK